jgi:hypothetical protein
MHVSAIERSASLVDWVKSWAGGKLWVAEPADWFYDAQQAGDFSLPQRDETWLWDPPPAAATVAVEQLGFARLKRHDTLRGIVVVPKILEDEWYQRFCKNVDFHFDIPAGAIQEWGVDQHETLTVGIYLPLLHHRPWDWKQCGFVVSLGRSLSAMFKDGESSGWSVLHELWESSHWISGMPECLVCDLLSNPSWRRFLNISSRRRNGRGWEC